MKKGIILSAAIFLLVFAGGCTADKTAQLVNVSYDPTREFYCQYNELFVRHWQKKTGRQVDIIQSHGGSEAQARSVIEGNDADVVTLALAHDIDTIAKTGLLEKDWQNKLPQASAPYTSTIVFLVRKGNPKNIKDWADLIRDDIGIITPNPKTSGGARWNYLAAWSYANEKYHGDEEQIKAFMQKIFSHVLVLDSGSRGATSTFVENKQGDVLLTWENEAYLAMREHPNEFMIISPSISILAQPCVAVVDRIARENDAEDLAHEYLSYLYSPEAQKIAAENFYRPTDENILRQYADKFDLQIKLVKIDDQFLGGWQAVNEKHFKDGGVFDQIYQAR